MTQRVRTKRKQEMVQYMPTFRCHVEKSESAEELEKVIANRWKSTRKC